MSISSGDTFRRGLPKAERIGCFLLCPVLAACPQAVQVPGFGAADCLAPCVLPGAVHRHAHCPHEPATGTLAASAHFAGPGVASGSREPRKASSFLGHSPPLPVPLGAASSCPRSRTKLLPWSRNPQPEVGQGLGRVSTLVWRPGCAQLGVGMQRSGIVGALP